VKALQASPQLMSVAWVEAVCGAVLKPESSPPMLCDVAALVKVKGMQLDHFELGVEKPARCFIS
jgi:hypothetical protein